MASGVTGPSAWTYCLALADIGHATRTAHLVADDGTRAQIARDLGLEALKSLQAELTVHPWLDGVEIRGVVRALATRICGVSLDPFDEAFDEPINVRILPQGSSNLPRAAPGEITFDPGSDDPAEEAPGLTIELCGYVIEHLALGLSPFPRKPDAVFEPPTESQVSSPFAALAGLKPAPRRR